MEYSKRFLVSVTHSKSWSAPSFLLSLLLLVSACSVSAPGGTSGGNPPDPEYKKGIDSILHLFVESYNLNYTNDAVFVETGPQPPVEPQHNVRVIFNFTNTIIHPIPGFGAPEQHPMDMQVELGTNLPNDFLLADISTSASKILEYRFELYDSPNDPSIHAVKVINSNGVFYLAAAVLTFLKNTAVPDNSDLKVTFNVQALLLELERARTARDVMDAFAKIYNTPHSNVRTAASSQQVPTP